MGVVYQAHQTKLDRVVALKVLPAQAGQDPAFAERFTREARALAKLNHPNILTIYDFGQAEGHSYFVMEFVDGVNLRQRLRVGRLHPQEALGIVAQICDALQFAHDVGIVHRDIKPENILLDKTGRVKIADFGIAKLLARKSADYTLTGPMQVVGTLHYMAPEQLENPLGLDHRADIYSLGVMFYEMLTGELPLGRFEPPSRKAPVDPRLDEIVLRTLERDPGRRYQRIGDLKSALAGVVGRQGPHPLQADTAPYQAPAPAAGPPPPPRAPSRSFDVGYQLGSFLATTSGWAIIFCLLGAVAGILPWATLSVLRQSSVRGAHEFVLGIAGWQGVLTTTIFLVLALILILTTRFAAPVPRWRSLLLAAAGAAVVGAAWNYASSIFVQDLELLKMVQSRSATTRVVGLEGSYLAAGQVFTMIFGTGLLFLTALQMRGRRVRRRRRGAVARFLGSSTGWAIVFCLLGTVAVLMPWAVVRLNGNLTPMQGIQTRWDYICGFNIWPGNLTMTLFLAMALYLLITTDFARPPSLARALLLFGIGLAVVLITGLFVSWVSAQDPVFEEWFRPWNPRQRILSWSVEDGPGEFIALIFGAGLLFLGTIQLRAVLLRAPEKPVPRPPSNPSLADAAE
jgi:hypothetical protein